MKKPIIVLSILCFLLSFFCVDLQSLQAQEMQQEVVDLPLEIQKTTPKYLRGQRRDPFRDLLGGRDVKEKPAVTGIPQMSIDDVVLIGIVKARGVYSAIINGPQGFPYSLKVGDQFRDGFVLSIKASQVVFRKTRDRGILLFKPKTIIKEIHPEER